MRRSGCSSVSNHPMGSTAARSTARFGVALHALPGSQESCVMRDLYVLHTARVRVKQQLVGSYSLKCTLPFLRGA